MHVRLRGRHRSLNARSDQDDGLILPQVCGKRRALSIANSIPYVNLSGSSERFERVG